MGELLFLALICAIAIGAMQSNKCQPCGGSGCARVKVIRGGREVLEIQPGTTCPACNGKGTK